MRLTMPASDEKEDAPQQLPKPLQDLLSARDGAVGGNGSSPAATPRNLITVAESDLKRDGKLGTSWLLLAEERVVVYEPDSGGAQLKTLINVPLAELRRPKAEALEPGLCFGASGRWSRLSGPYVGGQR